MAIHHATPGEVIDVTPLSAAPAIINLYEADGVADGAKGGEIIVQCLEGRIVFTAAGKMEELSSGQMLYLKAEEPHAVRCLEDASFLVTILANR